jgi:AcrR family transcriptional regulator
MTTKRKTEAQALPRGRHGLPRELVVENQRARLVSGMIERVAELGYGKATIADVIAVAKVSRKTFYESFANKEACYRAAYEASFEFLRERVAAGAEAEAWPDSVRGGLAALLESFAAHPQLAIFFLVSPASVGDEIAARHHLAIRELVELLLTKLPPPKTQDGAAEGIRAEALAGGLSRLAAMKVTSGEAEELPALLPDLIELFLRPYVGLDEAIRVAQGATQLDPR